MKIIIYSWPFAPSVGGLERLTEMTAVYLAQHGAEVTVVTATPDPEHRAGPFPFAVERRPSLRRLVELVRAAEIIQFNTFHTPTFGLAKALRKLTVWQHIDFDTICPRGICFAYGSACTFQPSRCYPCLRRDHSTLGTLRALAALAVKHQSASLVTLNLVSTSYAQSRMNLPHPEYLSFGIDTEKWTPMAPASPREPGAPLRALFYGRHIPAKGCDILVRAAAICRDRGILLITRIAGDGPHRAHSQRLAHELGVDGRVTFLGTLSEADLICEAQTCDVVVVPPTQDEIGQFVAFEAMSCGAPVVASDIGVYPEHIGEAGLLFTAGDAAALADRLEALATNPDLLQTLSARTRPRAVARFDWRVTGENYLRVYRRLLGKPIAPQSLPQSLGEGRSDRP